MPTISRFLGLMLRMFFNDHDPPHVHAVDKNGEVIYDLSAKILKVRGKGISSEKNAVVVAWIILRREQLVENWRLVRCGQKPNKIPRLS